MDNFITNNLVLFITFFIMILSSIIIIFNFFQGIEYKHYYKQDASEYSGISSEGKLNAAYFHAIADLAIFIGIPTLIFITDLIFVKMEVYLHDWGLIGINRLCVYVYNGCKNIAVFVIILLVLKTGLDIFIIVTGGKIRKKIAKQVKNQTEDELILLREKVISKTPKEDNETRLIFICSLESRADKNNLYGLNSELTNESKEIAPQIAKNININPDIIYTSTKLSAKQTALFMFKNIKSETSDILDECYFGNLEGLSKFQHDIYQENDFPNNICDKYKGENLTSKAQQAIKNITQLLEKNKTKKIVMITHPLLLSAIKTIINEKMINQKTLIKDSLFKNGEYIEANVNCFFKDDEKFEKPIKKEK